MTNGRCVELVRDIGGSPHVLLDAELAQIAVGAEEPGIGDVPVPKPAAAPETPIEIPAPATPQAQLASSATAPKPIFVGHGKNKTPLQQLQRLLTTFQIPHKIVVDEANLGRPISQEVKEL